MLRPRVSLLLLLAACGPGDSDAKGVTTGPDTTASSGPPTTATTAAPTTTAGDPSTSATTAETSTGDAPTGLTTEPGTGPVDPGTSTGDSTGTSAGTSAAETTSTGDTDAADVEYAAFFWAGGLDHIMVHRADFTHDRCTTLHLAWPGAPQPGLAITAPDGYAAQNAQVTAGVDGCLTGTPSGDVVAATSGSGAVVWTKGPQEYCPLQLDVDALLEFPLNMPWVPAQELLQAAALTVQNCP